eukprot:CAMPEP_0168620578 /NCGR_PEP_ID=MMETSP0449_2-20121227/7216_1 /TAXON_ID=1082188 /ORGANISM="Strombidium rassoulzadegani, Strain ras09" /LENGTH=60 /DNA_ID=CAMNT_0008661601 /DNA_START=297 /DNA_END=476 /DNA_ORIENTATION=+
MTGIDTKENPNAIPDYLDKHFKQKVEMKKQLKMMGGSQTEEFQQKIEEMDNQAQLNKNTV